MDVLMKPRTKLQNRSGVRQLFALPAIGCAAVFAASAAHAALWESPNWALTSKVEASGGYDSNLYARASGDGSGFATLHPQLRFFRRSSLTRFEINADAHAVKFFEYENEDSIDPSISLLAVYPESEDTLSSQQLKLAYVQSSTANADVGRRLRQSEAELSWEGAVAATGKSAFEGRTRIRHMDYREEGYSTNELAAIGASYNFVAHERLNLGAGYDLELARSKPGSSASQETESTGHAFTLRGRGDFLPKVSGRFHVGVSTVNYSGGLDRSDSDLIAGAALVWAVHERLSLTSKINRGTYFSPSGEVIMRSTVGFVAEQDIAGGFSLLGEIEGSQADYEHQSNSRRDNSVSLRGGVRYALTHRLAAGASCTWTTQDSDVSALNYDRTLVSGHLSCRF